MRFTRIKLRNWRNFLHLDVPLQTRSFLVGPNASGKSNFLDALRFLQQVADPQGGLQRALEDRGGVSRIRSLHARASSTVLVEVALELAPKDEWTYRLEFTQNKQRQQLVRTEEVHHSADQLLKRPDHDDALDLNRLTQTHLEQVSSNKEFRPLAELLTQVRYLHLVPQLLKDTDRYSGRRRDPYGADFLERLATFERANKRAFRSRLTRINRALRVAVPQLDRLDLERDERGAPHLKALYRHWRPNAGWQNERQLSDGTLRLLALLWSLLDGEAPLLIEEPELSLHSAVVSQLPRLIWQLVRDNGRQVILSTHSADLLTDSGVAAEEVILLKPTPEGTQAIRASDNDQIRLLLEGGLPLADAVMPRSAPEGAEQLSLFE